MNPNGAISAVVLGADPSETIIFQWSTGSTSNSINSLPEGNYQLTVTTSSGCELIDSAQIIFEGDSSNTDCSQLSLNLTPTNTTDTLNPNGAISAVVLGANPSETIVFQWSTGSTSNSINSLPEGNYQLTVTTSSGCELIDSAQIIFEGDSSNTNCQLSIEATSTDETNYQANDGTVSVSDTNGVSPIVYAWSNNSSSSAQTNLEPGTYTVTVTDANGCSATASVVIDAVTDPCTNFTIDFNITNESESNASDGSVAAEVNNGTSPFTFSWNFGQTTSTINGLNAGQYTVSVTDANNCTSSNSSVVEVCELEAALSVTQPSSINASDGLIFGSVDNGNPPYYFNWSDGSNGSLIQNLDTGFYYLVVNDGRNCTDSVSVLMDNINTSINEVSENSMYTVFPNPTQGLFLISSKNSLNNNVQIAVYNSVGQIIFSDKAINSKSIEIDGTNWSNGVYTIQVNNEEEINKIKIIKK